MSTVKIITQGRNVTVTPAIREYVVRIWLLMWGSWVHFGMWGRQWLSQLRFARLACQPSLHAPQDNPFCFLY